MEPVTLTTERFVLSAPRASDVDAVFTACQDADVQLYTTVPVPYEREHAVAFVDQFVPDSWANDSEYVFGIREAANAPLIGVVSWQRERGYVGYWLDAAHRGRGVMTEVLQALVDWVFTHEVDAVRWEALAGNMGSAIVAQRAGFRWDGIGPASYAGQSGRAGEAPMGWYAVLRRADLGTIEPREAWPGLSAA